MTAAPPSTFPNPFPAPQTSSPLPVPKAWRSVPLPTPAPEIAPLGRLALPAWPAMGTETTAPVASTPALAALPPEPVPPTPPAAFPPFEAVANEPEPRPPFEAVPSPASTEAPAPDFTDADLRDAFAPIFQQIFKDITLPAAGHDPQLEPMLRATIRRALAEYTPGNRPFTPPGAWDRFVWRTQALFSSRSYEDILFEKTHRFHVEEVYLVDATSLALVSYASINPARHASTRRIQSTVQRLALQVRDEEGATRPFFKLANERNVISQKGEFIILMAIIRGVPTDLAISDLCYTVETIEKRFREHFTKDGTPLLRILQPFLEDCLLIQAPASAA